MYENKENPDRDPINLYEKYAKERPANYSGAEDPFYISPNTQPITTTNCRCSNKQIVGANKLGAMMKTMTTDAGIGKRQKINKHK